MGILNWQTRRRPVELDEDDLKEELRAYLAIAAGEKMANSALATLVPASRAARTNPLIALRDR